MSASSLLQDERLDFKKDSSLLTSVVCNDSTLTGTIAVTSGSKVITGTGSSFLTQLSIGSDIIIGSETIRIASITSNFIATAENNVTTTASGSYSKVTMDIKHGSTAVLTLQPRSIRMKSFTAASYGSIPHASDQQGNLLFFPGIPLVETFQSLSKSDGTELRAVDLSDAFKTSFGGTLSDNTVINDTTATAWRDLEAASGAVMSILHQAVHGVTGSSIWHLRINLSNEDVGGFFPTGYGIFEMVRKNNGRCPLWFYGLTGHHYQARYRYGNANPWTNWTWINNCIEKHANAKGNQTLSIEFPRFASGQFAIAFRENNSNSIVSSGVWTTDHSTTVFSYNTYVHRGFSGKGLLVNATGAAATGTVSISAGSMGVTGSGTAFTTELKEDTYIMIGSEVMHIHTITSDTQLVLKHSAKASYSAQPFYAWGYAASRTVVFQTTGIGTNNRITLNVNYTTTNTRHDTAIHY